MSTSPPTSPVGPSPRVCTHPPYVRSLGAVAVKLGEKARMRPDPWQADALELICSLRADGKWACYEYCEWVPRQNGKGTILELRALLGFLVLGEELIVWSAHQYKTAARAFRRVQKLIKRLGKRPNPKNKNLYVIDGIGPEPIEVKILNTHGEEGFERLDTGAQIVFIARSDHSGIGFTADLQIIDEALKYTLEEHEALLPTLSAVPNAQIIYTSTPPLTGETGEVMYSLRLRGDPTAPREEDDGQWAQQARLGYRDWGAGSDLERFEKDKIQVDDPALWKATNPAAEIRIAMEVIRTEFESMGKRGFAKQRLGIWPAQSKVAKALFDAKVWRDAADPNSRRHGDIVLMPDATPMQDHATIGLFGLRADGLEHVQLVDYREHATWLVARMVELHKELDPLCWVIDSKNAVASFLPDLAEHGIKVPDDPAKPERGNILLLDADAAAKATGALINAHRANLIRHLNDEPLNDAVVNVKARPIGDQGQIGFARRKAEVDIGPVVTIAGARLGFYEWRDKVAAAGPVQLEGRLYGGGMEDDGERVRGALAHSG